MSIEIGDASGKRCPYTQTAPAYDPEAAVDRVSAYASVLMARAVVAREVTPHEAVEPDYVDTAMTEAAAHYEAPTKQRGQGYHLKTVRYMLQAVITHLAMDETGILVGKGRHSRFTVTPQIKGQDILPMMTANATHPDIILMRGALGQVFDAGLGRLKKSPMLGLAHCIEAEHTQILKNDPSCLATKVPNTLVDGVGNGGGEFPFEVLGFVAQVARESIGMSPEGLRAAMHNCCRLVMAESAMRVENFVARPEHWGVTFSHEGKELQPEKIDKRVQQPLGPRIGCPANFRLVRNPDGSWREGVLARAAHAAINYFYEGGWLEGVGEWGEWPTSHPYKEICEDRIAQLSDRRAEVAALIEAAGRPEAYRPTLLFDNALPDDCKHPRHLALQQSS